MNKKLYIIEYFIILNIFLFKYANNEIIFVYEHCRHGIRGSLSKFKQIKIVNNTFYDEFNIPWEGNGDLTLKGKIQHYILGIRNRYKYPNLINFSQFNPNELLIHVTNKSRVIISAYYQLLGMLNPIIEISKNDSILINNISNKLYYPPNYIIWEKNKTNIHLDIINEAERSIKFIKEKNNNNNNSTNKFLDYKINNYILSKYLENRTFYVKRYCKNYQKYIEYNYINKYKDLIQDNFEKKYEDVFRRYFNYSKEYLYNIKNSSTLVDSYIVDIYEEKNLTNFFRETKIDKNDFYNTCLIIYEWWLYNIITDKVISMIDSSKLMEDLIGYMESNINKKNKINMIIDVGHERTIGSIEFAMNQIFGVDYFITNFASNVIFELHKIKDENKDKYNVEYYIDEQLKLNISYDKFKEKIIKNVWTEKRINNFCFGNITRILHPKIYLLTFIFIINILLGIFILIIFKYCIKNKIKRNKHYKEYDEENKENGKEMELI